MAEKDCVFQGTSGRRDFGTSGLRDIAGDARIFFVVPRTRSLVIPRTRGLVFSSSRGLVVSLSRGLVVSRTCCLAVSQSRRLVGAPLSAILSRLIYRVQPIATPRHTYIIYIIKGCRQKPTAFTLCVLSQLLILHLSLQLCKTCDVAKSGLLNRSVNLLNG